jgi:stearoyl-CoA desaturase (delta-9 desaturase)
MTELLYTLILTHITIICVTVFLHRGQAHKGIEFHPILSHFMRFWLWLTTGMKTKDWVAIHRKHHSSTDKEGDPHSPHVYGIKRVLFGGALLYHDASKNFAMVENFGKGTPDDWLEKNLYSAHSRLGILSMFALNILLFGYWGFLIWLVQMLWIPFWAAGVINGVGHWFGYRNTDTKDKSTNIIPWGIIIGGEELHNNHHSAPASSRLSKNWYEFDLGWLYIQMFKHVRLLKLKNTLP